MSTEQKQFAPAAEAALVRAGKNAHYGPKTAVTPGIIMESLFEEGDVIERFCTVYDANAEQVQGRLRQFNSLFAHRSPKNSTMDHMAMRAVGRAHQICHSENAQHITTAHLLDGVIAAQPFLITALLPRNTEQ